MAQLLEKASALVGRGITSRAFSGNAVIDELRILASCLAESYEPEVLAVSGPETVPRTITLSAALTAARKSESDWKR